MNNTFISRLGVQALLLLAVVSLLSACEKPPAKSVQWGYRGTGMVDIEHPATMEANFAANQVPEGLPAADPSGPRASEVYKNVKVLGDLSAGQFTRVMLSISNWVAPQQGCAYCHNLANFADDSLYTKVVARKMLQMTRHINSDWKSHVQGTGVTCYTCHRGNPVPAYVWFKDEGPRTARGYLGDRMGIGSPKPSIGMSSLPFDPFTNYLDNKENIRMAATTALPTGEDRQSIKQTEWTYALMMHFSKSLGVNCTYCHNSRAFADWKQSTPQRSTAWYGIRMVRDLNNDYMKPLTEVFPAHRLGPTGDVAKAYCSTCHQGIYKPLYGVSMAKDYPELQGPSPNAAAKPVREDSAEESVVKKSKKAKSNTSAKLETDIGITAKTAAT
jgi:photosynthetic reaction center cytochrome c subunit